MLTEQDLIDGYRTLAKATVPDRVARAHMTEQVMLDRIGQLLKYRRWYRRQTALWADLARENDVELRGLLRVARKARALSAAPLAFDAEGTLLGEAWTEPELREAFGG